MSVSIYNNPTFTDSPYGFKLQQSFSTAGTFSVTIPTGIQRVYAIVIGGGGAGASVASGGVGGGGAGGYSVGWTYATNTVTVGAGGAGSSTAGAGANGAPSIYGMVMAGGGSGAQSNTQGGGGGGVLTPNQSSTSAISYTGAPSIGQGGIAMLAVLIRLVFHQAVEQVHQP